jgi:hypothetical protein
MNAPTAIIAQADATRLPLPSASVDLVMTSPPYSDARTYGIGAQRGCAAWILWMLDVITECCRVSRGLVLVNCAGVTRKRIYQPGPEGLMYEWWKRGGVLWRPAYWHRVGIPGSGGRHWLRSDIEYVLCFSGDSEWPAFAEPTANGHPPKWGPGGEMSNRQINGDRVNKWGHNTNSPTFAARKADGERDTRNRPSHQPFGNQQSSVGRRADGTPKPPYFNGNSMRATRGTSPTGEQLPNRETAFPVLANPGNLIKGIVVGGGVMGHPLCHENEAPFPVKLAEYFIRAFCPPDGIVLDPFCGSGTTAHAAANLGRRAIIMDLRYSQCTLARRRLATPYTPKAKKPKAVQVDAQSELFAGVS